MTVFYGSLTHYRSMPTGHGCYHLMVTKLSALGPTRTVQSGTGSLHSSLPPALRLTGDHISVLNIVRLIYAYGISNTTYYTYPSNELSSVGTINESSLMGYILLSYPMMLTTDT